MNQELPDVEAGFRKGRGSRYQHPLDHSGGEKQQGNDRETSTFDSLTLLKPFTMWITINWKILKDMGMRPPYLNSERPLCRTKSNSENQTWNNALIQNWERVCQGCILLPCLINLFGRVHHVKCQAE